MPSRRNKGAAAEAAGLVRALHNADCGLALVTDMENKTVYAAFTMPAGNTEWDSGYPRMDATMQTRGAVLALERVRRFLTAG